jgi:hypothetical protein
LEDGGFIELSLAKYLPERTIRDDGESSPRKRRAHGGGVAELGRPRITCKQMGTARNSSAIGQNA